MIDTTTANHFLRIMNAVRLLGTQGIVAGIQTRVALALVSLGIDLSGITTARNVQEALEICARAP
jgi:rsbT co-antagonist protein RsbR